MLGGTAAAREWALVCVPWTLLTVLKLRNRLEQTVDKIKLRNILDRGAISGAQSEHSYVLGKARKGVACTVREKTLLIYIHWNCIYTKHFS